MAAASSSSRQIFVQKSGQPITFHVPICENKPRMKQLIENHGGVLVENADDALLVILPKGADTSRLTTKQAIVGHFIDHCVKEGRLLPWQDYVVGRPGCPGPGMLAKLEEVAPKSEYTGMRAPLHLGAAPVAPACGGHGASKVKFSAEDDNALRKWVISHPGTPELGQKLWQLAERARITSHSWQSMHNRYKRYLRGGQRPVGVAPAVKLEPPVAPAVKRERFERPPATAATAAGITATRPRVKIEATEASQPAFTESTSASSVHSRFKRNVLAAADISTGTALSDASRRPETKEMHASLKSEAASKVFFTASDFEGLPDWVLATQDFSIGINLRDI